MKNREAVRLGAKGGRARWRGVSVAARAAIMRRVVAARWRKSRIRVRAHRSDADLALIRAFGRALTRRQHEVLRTMAERQAADPGDDEAELVRECCDAWLGDERVASRTVDALLRACAISDTGTGGIERYRINETGREILAQAAAP